MMQKKSDLFFTILIIGVIVFFLFKGIKRQINEDLLKSVDNYKVAKIIKVRYGKGTTQIEYEFKSNGKVLKGKDLCSFNLVKDIQIGDYFLINYNFDMNFSEIYCDCEIPLNKINLEWKKFPKHICVDE